MLGLKLNYVSKRGHRWMPQNLTDDKSTLVQIMALWHQTTSQYLSKYWPGSMSPYVVTRPQWLKSLGHVLGSSNVYIIKHVLVTNILNTSFEQHHKTDCWSVNISSGNGFVLISLGFTRNNGLLISIWESRIAFLFNSDEIIWSNFCFKKLLIGKLNGL